MKTFEDVKIRGYRRLVDVHVPMRDLTVMIGANGVGKTSFLEVFALLAASAHGEMEPKFAELGGISDILTRDRAEDIQFDLSMNVPDHAPLNYHLEIASVGQSYQIRSETLSQQSDRDKRKPFLHIDSRGSDIKYFNHEDRNLVRPNWEHTLLETSLSQVPKMYQAPETLRKRLASSTFYGALNVAPKSAVRLPQSMRPATLPGANGEDLISCLYYLRETDPTRFEDIEDTLAAAFPDFEKLSFPPVAAGTLSLTWKDRNFSKPLYMHQLSEGTLRFLWLATLLQSTDLTAITLIDEPEVSLHPDLLRLLGELMRDAALRTQLIIATHSDRLVRFLKPEEVLVCDTANGEAKFVWADELNLDRWLADYSLDELWAMNLIGGRS